MAVRSLSTIATTTIKRPFESLRTVSTYRRDRIVSRARINPNRSKATTHLRSISPTREFRVRAGNDNVLRRRVSISWCVRQRYFRTAIALGSVLETGENEPQTETFAHTELDSHCIARVTEDARVQSFIAAIVVVAA